MSEVVSKNPGKSALRETLEALPLLGFMLAVVILAIAYKQLNPPAPNFYCGATFDTAAELAACKNPDRYRARDGG